MKKSLQFQGEIDNDSSQPKSWNYSGQRKPWILILLVFSCITAFFLLMETPSESPVRLSSSEEIDEIIQETLHRFQIPDEQVHTQAIRIDSVHTRRAWSVEVSPVFSKTEWHYELAKQLRPYHVDTPARVIFPEQDLHIYVVYGGNIVRTIRLETIQS